MWNVSVEFYLFIIQRTELGRDSLLRPSNIDNSKLEDFAIEAATFSTRHFSSELPITKFSSWKGKNDVSIFDFTVLSTSRSACQVLEQAGSQLLVAVVGDSLMEPFWPEGTGIGRGFLSVLDTAWLTKRWVEVDRTSREAVLEVIREREKLYSLLRQTGPSQLQSTTSRWSINPSSRYSTRQFSFHSGHVPSLYRTHWEGEEETDSQPGGMKSQSWSEGLNRSNLEIFSSQLDHTF